MHNIEIPEITITFKDTEVVLPATKIVEEPLIEIEVNPQQYTLTNDNIYLIEQYGVIPPWLKDMIDTVIEDNPISTDLDDLIEYVEQLEDGFTGRIDYIENEQEQQLSEIRALKLTDDRHGAAIVDLDLVKIDEDRATSISEDVVIAWSTNGSGGAWFDTRIKADRTAIASNASVISSLVATTTTQGNAINDAFGSIDDLKKQNDGLIETLFYDSAVEGTNGPVGPQGELLTDKEPYATWKTDDTRSLHTGDTYVLYEIDPNTNQKHYIGSWRFGKIESDIGQPNVDEDGFGWIAIIDAQSQEAYQLALNAKQIGDGKSLFIYDPNQPNLDDPKYNDPVSGEPYATISHIGDIWYNDDVIRVLQQGDGTHSKDITFTGHDIDGNPAGNFTWRYTEDKYLSIRIDTVESVTAGQFTVYGYKEMYEGEVFSPTGIEHYPKDEIGDDITSLEYGMVIIVKRQYRDYYSFNPDNTTPDGIPFKWSAPRTVQYYSANTGIGPRFYNEVWQYTSKALGSDGWVQQESLGLYGTYAVASKLIMNSNGSITGWTMADGSNGSSLFQINADKFIIENSGGTKQPFVIDTTVSPTEMRINSDMLINGAIKSSNYKVNTNPDPHCGYDITGFAMDSTTTYNIVGGKIFGSEMVAGSLHSYGYQVGGSLDQSGFSLHSCANQNNGYNIIGGSVEGDALLITCDSGAVSDFDIRINI